MFVQTEQIGMTELGRLIGCSGKQAGRFFDLDLVEGGVKTEKGTRRMFLNPETLAKTLDRIWAHEFAKGGQGLSIEMKQATREMHAAAAVSDDEVEVFLLAGVLQRAIDREREPSWHELQHYRDCTRYCLIRDDPAAAMENLSKKDTAFGGIHPADNMLATARDILRTVSVSRKGVSSLDYLRALASFALAMCSREEASTETEAAAMSVLHQIMEREGVDAYERVIDMLDKMNQHSRVRVVMAMAELPTEKRRAYWVKRLIQNPPPRRLNRLAGEYWHLLRLPKPKRGWGSEPKVFWKTLSAGKELKCFGWELTGVEGAASSFRRKFGEDLLREIATKAAKLVGVDDDADPRKPNKEKLREAIDATMSSEAPRFSEDDNEEPHSGREVLGDLNVAVDDNGL